VKEIGACGADFTRQVRAVRRAIDVHGCRLIDEIMDDVQLSRWAVNRAVQKLLAEKAIEARDGFLLDHDADEPGRPPVEYHPAHYPRGEDFSHTLRRAVEDDLL
jgi:predicted ArsR family transcriptional regulator